MPDCPKCGLEDAPFGKNKSRPNGLSYWCKMCTDETRIHYAETANWTEINRKRRANPEYRAKEREKANQRDKERRLTDPSYVLSRSASHRKYINSEKGQAADFRRDEKRRQKRRQQLADMEALR